MTLFRLAAPGGLAQPVPLHRQRGDQRRRNYDRGPFDCQNSKTQLHRIFEEDNRRESLGRNE